MATTSAGRAIRLNCVSKRPASMGNNNDDDEDDDDIGNDDDHSKMGFERRAKQAKFVTQSCIKTDRLRFNPGKVHKGT